VETCAPDDDCLVCDPVDACVPIAPIPPGCEIAGLCGNGTTDQGEECDDGNTDDGDGCSAFCLIEDVELICRTAGFYATHAAEKLLPRGGLTLNITQDLLDAPASPLTICGVPIESTNLNDGSSALEALCVSPQGAQELQLIRQLTAAGLNCILSGAGIDCSNSGVEFLFADCDATCLDILDGTLDDPSAPSVEDCIFELDCFNNGGIVSFDGLTCDPVTDGCHDLSLCPADDPDGDIDDFCFEPPGPAGSGQECKDAKKTACTILSCDPD
jgi:cysteine-rich repeat protein